jgi:hypothetical protein
MIITSTAIPSGINERRFCRHVYWIAFTNVQDAAHERARAMALPSGPTAIVTTEEVLIEYMNYFSAWSSNFRRKALINTR